MAGIEKICEFSGDYPAGAMYEYKRNHIQICPKYRKQFATKPHVLLVFAPTTVYSLWRRTYVKEWAYILYVPDLPGRVEGRYLNWSTNMTTVYRKLRRMMKQQLNVVKLNKTFDDYCTENSDDDLVQRLTAHIES